MCEGKGGGGGGEEGAQLYQGKQSGQVIDV